MSVLLLLLLAAAGPAAGAGAAAAAADDCGELRARVAELEKERGELLELVKFQTDSKHALAGEVAALHEQLAREGTGAGAAAAAALLRASSPELRAAFNKTMGLLGAPLAAGGAVLESTGASLNATLTPLVGQVHAGWVAGAGTALLVAVPLAVSSHFLLRLRAAVTLRGELIALTCYLSTTFSLLFGASWFVECGEALAAMRLYNGGAYAAFQLLMLVLLLLHATSAARYCLQLLRAPKGGGRPTRRLMLGALLQALASLALGVHYYVGVWRPAMLDRAPEVELGTHAAFAANFTAGFYVAVMTRPRGRGLPTSSKLS